MKEEHPAAVANLPGSGVVQVRAAAVLRGFPTERTLVHRHFESMRPTIHILP